MKAQNSLSAVALFALCLVACALDDLEKPSSSETRRSVTGAPLADEDEVRHRRTSKEAKDEAGKKAADHSTAVSKKEGDTKEGWREFNIGAYLGHEIPGILDRMDGVEKDSTASLKQIRLLDSRIVSLESELRKATAEPADRTYKLFLLWCLTIVPLLVIGWIFFRRKRNSSDEIKAMIESAVAVAVEKALSERDEKVAKKDKGPVMLILTAASANGQEAAFAKVAEALQATTTLPADLIVGASKHCFDVKGLPKEAKKDAQFIVRLSQQLFEAAGRANGEEVYVVVDENLAKIGVKQMVLAKILGEKGKFVGIATDNGIADPFFSFKDGHQRNLPDIAKPAAAAA